MRTMSAIVLALLLGACGSEAKPTPAAEANDHAKATTRAAPGPHLASGASPDSDLAACTAPEDVDPEYGVREAGLEVPAAFKGVVRSNRYHFVVATLDSGAVCVDTSWMWQIEDARVDGRFLSFAWAGYEAFGHILVDRASAGTVIDTGNAPVFSPSEKLVAGLEVTEAGWGGLEGLAIWRVTPTGLVEHFTLVANEDGLLPEVFRGELADWRIDDWIGEDCLAISAVTWDALNAADGYADKAERTPFHARAIDDWAIEPGRAPEACRRD